MSSNLVVTILNPDGSQLVNTTIGDIDAIYHEGSAQTISLSAQMGAVFIMLVVVLVMTPKERFRLLPTSLNIAALLCHLVRMIFQSIYAVSAWNDFTSNILNDYTHVPRIDYNNSIVSTVSGLSVTILVELALIVQAWCMIQLWPAVYKWSAAAVSFGIVVATIVFLIWLDVVQVRFILYNVPNKAWVVNTYYILFTTSISWFCALFIIRLALHMWKKRSILPSIKGLSAMDSLVITNGVLMVIPIVFAILQFVSSVDFFAFILTQTTVVLVLPLGSMVAQRLSNAALPTEASLASANIITNLSGVGSVASQNRPLLADRSSNTTSGGVFRAGQVNNGSPTVTSEARFDKVEASHVDHELTHIDDPDLERGLGPGVRVDRRIESSEERLADSTGMSGGHQSS